MKRFLAAALIAGALVIVDGALAAPGQVRDARVRKPSIEKAVAQFNEPVKLLNVILKGKYLFLHHEGMMAQGKPCTFVYTLDGEKPGKLVISFHCVPVSREKSDSFLITVIPNLGSDPPEMVEIRFAGSAEGHLVPRQAEE